ncbi:MAG: DUF29 domain-containing protein [Vulcanimicrobiaceae bacterium]
MAVVSGTSSPAYDHDLAAWSEAQAALLRAGAVDQLDIEHIAEELEGLSARERQELESHLETILAHLLKLHVAPNDDARNVWNRPIREARRNLRRLFKRSPSIKRLAEPYLLDGYPDAREVAADSLDRPVSDFPATNLWSLGDVLG